jgi:putative endonuclease
MKPVYRRMLRGMQAKAEDAGPDQTAAWHLYILRCGDGSFYTGVSTDIERRLGQHQDGKASRYTRTHRPVALVHREECGTRSQALSRECAVKALSRAEKEDLVAGGRKAKAVKPARTAKKRKAAKAKKPGPGRKR